MLNNFLERIVMKIMIQRKKFMSSKITKKEKYFLTIISKEMNVYPIQKNNCQRVRQHLKLSFKMMHSHTKTNFFINIVRNISVQWNSWWINLMKKVDFQMTLTTNPQSSTKFLNLMKEGCFSMLLYLESVTSEK